MAVADHQPPDALVPLDGVPGQVGVDLSLQGGGHGKGVRLHVRTSASFNLRRLPRKELLCCSWMVSWATVGPQLAGP
jgi:hypothetical protein